MKVLVVNSMTPFSWGGAEELAANLTSQLIKHGHQAELLRIPFQWEPAERIPQQMLLARTLELRNVDHVIAMKFPAYLIRHPRKTLWLVHQYRQAYDLFDAKQSNLPPGPAGSALRQLIKAADEETFHECRGVYTIGEVVTRRLAHYNGIVGKTLPFPLHDPELFAGGTSRGYIFAGGRVNTMKRQHLLVEAMAYAPKSVRLVIAGPPETPSDAERLERLVENHHLFDRVKLDLRFLPRAEIGTYVNGALACAYLPFDEDAVGYVTMEAAAAGKAIISASDSGGVLALAKHGETGWVVDPTPRALAMALAQATQKPADTGRLGRAAREMWTRMNVSWSGIIERLLT